MNPFAQPQTTQIWLESTCQASISGLAYITRGWNTRIFSFECRGHSWILRIAQSADHVLKEALAYQYLGKVLPLPPVWKTGQVAGWYWAIVHRCPGKSLDQLAASEQALSTLDVLTLHLQLLQQPLLHPGAGPWKTQPDYRPVFTHWNTYLAELGGMKTRLPDLLQQPIALSSSELEQLYAYVQASELFWPCSPVWLIHGDFKPANIIVASGDTQTRITGWWIGPASAKVIFSLIPPLGFGITLNPSGKLFGSIGFPIIRPLGWI